MRGYISWNSRKHGFTPSMFSSVSVVKDEREPIGWIVYNKGKKVNIRLPRETTSRKQHLYVYVDFRQGDKVFPGRTMSLASIIWLRYLSLEIPAGYVVDHIDEDPLNNKLDNLQILTIGENARKARKLKNK